MEQVVAGRVPLGGAKYISTRWRRIMRIQSKVVKPLICAPVDVGFLVSCRHYDY